MKLNKRIDYLDYGKGFAIILMVLAHSMSGDNPIKTWIESFFMPIFFVISGMLLYIRFNSEMTKSDLWNLFKKRIFQLGIPYIVFSLLISAYYLLIQVVSGSPIKLSNYLISIITLHGIESMWFIPCIFVAELLLGLVLCYRWKGRYIAGGFAILTIIFITLFTDNMPENESLRLLIVWSVGFLFEYIGMLVAKYRVIERTNIIIGVLLAVAGVVLAEINGPIGMAALDFKNGLLTVLNATITSIAILTIFAYFDKNVQHRLRFLIFTGKDSIVILCTNNLLIEIFRLLDYRLTGNVFLGLGIPGAFMFAAIIMVFEVLIIFLSHTRIKVIFGKK